MKKNSKKKPLLLDIHKEWCENNYMSQAGLCHSLKDISRKKKIRCKRQFDLFKPTDHDRDELREESKSTIYWADGREFTWLSESSYDQYTSLRQTIVLFICAMKEEI